MGDISTNESLYLVSVEVALKTYYLKSEVMLEWGFISAISFSMLFVGNFIIQMFRLY